MELHIKPIGIIHSPFQSAVQTPIQPAAAGGTRGRVELFPEYAPGLLDIKPYAPQFDGFDVRRTGWLEHRQVGNTKADDRFHRKENP